MTGISSAIGTGIYGSFLPIVVEQGSGNILGFVNFEWAVSDDNLLGWTGKALEVFENIEDAVIRKADEQRREGLPLGESLTLTPEICRQYLTTLAKWGTLAYREFFDDNARESLAEFFQQLPGVPAPTIFSKLTPFPWEVFYEGEDYRTGDPKHFWGLRYAPARILDLRNIKDYAKEQNAPSKMLFCLHHQLRAAHQREWPYIEGLVRITEQDQVELLGPTGALQAIIDGETLLEHLYKGEHNMLHFACHANPLDVGADVLRMSLITMADLAGTTEKNFSEIALDTDMFTLNQGVFANKPLVFLNACKSGAGGDRLRETYNLPRKFVECQAGAVIATACPVPDIFAAEFARVFYGYFLRGRDMLAEHPEQTDIGPQPIGEALRLTRCYFIEKHYNPLGLAYGLYSPAHYRMAQVPQAVGLAP